MYIYNKQIKFSKVHYLIYYIYVIVVESRMMTELDKTYVLPKCFENSFHKVYYIIKMHHSCRVFSFKCNQEHFKKTLVYNLNSLLHLNLNILVFYYYNYLNMLLKQQNQIFKKCSIMSDDIMNDVTMP